MIGFRRHRLPLVLRVLVLAMFVLGVAMQPVLASLGELHELSHDPSGSHAHAAHAGDAVAAETADGEGNPRALHVLLDFAHCCGQPTAMPLSSPQMPMAIAASVALPMGPSQPPTAARNLAPYRPPIV
ncbi:hypothetical protein [Montanilutibacter psychrotolerans]|uniref:DUF2946 domain-containing protein n=1 Tax=Montanilutibacter psychrotolerans TaxID=1327343 RepID=A0A3M8SUL8_9GAMM|nr:hypothetical protein [Lysobacter psychrotolerans]RNF82550.1 hypothetical protein EER27_13655 [Lysobacter psychrotolerans]